MDPNTAHTSLSLSDGNRRVTAVREKQKYPDHPDRFSDKCQVLSRESLIGRSYWEVELSGEWVYVAVSYRDIQRKGDSDEYVKKKMKERALAFKSGDVLAYKLSRYFLERSIKAAKRAYGARIENYFIEDNPRLMWKGLSSITSWKPKVCCTESSDPDLPNKLNQFYCRFESVVPEFVFPECLDQCCLSVTQEDVQRTLSRTNVRKSPGPDNIPPRALKLCSVQLAPVLTDIFNMSLRSCEVPDSFKKSIVIPVPKKTPVTCLNDYRPVALTSVLMKCFERLVLDFIRSQIPVSVDPLQFAYRPNRSTEDAISFALNCIYSHLDTCHSAARMLFIDYSSAFNSLVKAKRGHKTLVTYAFLDPGSTASFCTERLMNQLNLNGRKLEILLRTMGQEKVVDSYMLADLEVAGLDSDNFCHLPEIFTQKNMPALEPWEVVRAVDGGPYAIKTILGWTVNGPLRGECQASERDLQPDITVNRISVARLDELWEKQLKVDFPETQKDEQLGLSKEDELFMESVSESVKIVDGHYSIGLPVRQRYLNMPNNKTVAEQRALSLKRRLLKDHTFRSDYVTFMSGMIAKGYAERVPSEHLTRRDGRVWYIPHHGVYHPQKKNLRVVFDCGATFQGTSLNSQLLQGPDLTSSLVGVLTRFRKEPVVLMADVEAMFLQVQVPAEDRDLLRFLWWPEGDCDQELVEYRMVAHLFGATSSPSCASFALRKCAEDNRDHFSLVAVNTLLHHFYVDDCLVSVASESEAVSLCQELSALCARGGFKLTKWVSNHRSVLAAIPHEERAKEVKDLDLDNDALPVERALGVQWCVQSDSFKFKITLKNRPLTRRGILSVISSVYDPLGFLAPIILTAKKFVQDLCRRRLGWDDPLPPSVVRDWMAWLEDLHLLEHWEVSRCLKPVDFGDLASAQLHHFADASEEGFGTVTYLLLHDISGRVHCAFVMGKARVAPLKPVTIPRMELTAAVVASRMDKLWKKELQMELKDSVFWTDSTSVLKYIKNETSRFKIFVANRVSEILKLSKVSQWRYVNTLNNPADLASRGAKVDAFLKNDSWLCGPDFLLEPESSWPTNPEVVAEPLGVDPEIKVVVVNMVQVEQASPMEKLINYFSTWLSLKRAVGWLVKFKNLLFSLVQHRRQLKETLVAADMSIEKLEREIQVQMKSFKAQVSKDLLSVEDMDAAEKVIVRFCQRTRYPEEFACLERGECLKKTSHLYKLNPILDDGLIRVGGRLSRAAMPVEAKHPVILAKDLHLARLILCHVHQETGHSGRNHMLSHLRQRYWIPGACAAIRKILAKCVICRRLSAVPGHQKMSDLPLSRITPDEPPFSRVGLVCFGPFEVKRGRAVVKRYGLIFTCLAIRAIHLEVLSSLDTDLFINGLRRFIARRGQVLEIRSDNGTNFVGAERELKEALEKLNHTLINGMLLQKNVKWLFNTPAASHHGGTWERLVRSVRKVLNSILKTQNLDEEGLVTVFCEAEAIVNSRPITKASTDPNDLEALTPNHLLLLKSQPSLPPGLFEKGDVYARRRWKQVQYMSDLFWKRWLKEYLPSLQERQKWNRVRRNFIPGDIVMLVDDMAPRNSWITARILDTVLDKNGLVRTVRIKTKTSILDRPITKVCLLQEAEEQ
ncbi:hypothetical protein WMY93_002041 [Mugilogobius chulae]|uniref:Integrase catalytic domain-containing protein n=1 Tax=Mugilogobius chulae TaxID=88201 RepID=A0AAW0PUR4_9GOBI